MLVYLLAATNLLAFGLMAADKTRARKKRWRIPERVLFLAALCGGGVGAVVGMAVLRHKTRKWYFAFGLPLIAAAQTAALVYYLW